jgi:small GTP-binding protein
VIQKKVCMLGATAVGKTSLVSRFVHSIFSDKYLTSVGVKIDKKSINAGDQRVDLILWDLNGEDDFQKIRMSYLRGTSGYLLVIDGTRGETLDMALSLRDSAERAVGRVPFLLVANKADLASSWEVDDAMLGDLSKREWPIIRTSAKTGVGVEEAFAALTRAMLQD